MSTPSPAKAPVPIQPVEQPIICSPYEAPNLHWHCDRTTGQWIKTAGRRPSRYYWKERRVDAKGQLTFSAEDERADPIPLINDLREDVARWRDSRYEGATVITKKLLDHYRTGERKYRLFFCQLEAVETVVYLAEIIRSGRRPRFTPRVSLAALSGLNDEPLEPGLLPLTRFGCKMATGSGKTIVMSMLIAWAFCNRGKNPSDERFANGVLVCAPNLTVKERLQVLRPDREGNYYEKFNIVPGDLRTLMHNGKVLIENWHQFAPASEHSDGGTNNRVINKGPESVEAFARRVLGDLYDRLPVMVMNDEAHHCYRPKTLPSPAEAEAMRTAGEEPEEATVWIRGLDRINNAFGAGAGGSQRPGVQMCVDLSATPFYLAGSGYPEGSPHPWLVSDFGLMDAIESGITKIPRLPVMDTTGRTVPKYFRLWEWMKEQLTPQDVEPGRARKPRPKAVWTHTEDAVRQLATQWLQRFEQFKKARPGIDQVVPPVMIVVCDNTDIAEDLYRRISGERVVANVTEADVAEALAEEREGDELESEVEAAPTKTGKTKAPKERTVYGKSEVLEEFANTESVKHTIRIDSDLLAKAEAGDGQSRKDAAEKLRQVVATVGKPGQPGEHVRCVVSVAMLTEGWDASNVTHILGLRAFGSQLLCEQVVGRGLRRMKYDVFTEASGGRLLEAEYVDVYGIPFSVIPFKGKPADKPAPEDKPSHYVTALPERAHHEIRWPIVEGYAYAMTENKIRCDVAAMQRTRLEPSTTPIETFLMPRVGYSESLSDNMAPFGHEKQSREEYYRRTHPQAVTFQLAHAVLYRIIGRQVFDGVPAKNARNAEVFALRARAQLFPQVLRTVDEYVRTKVDYAGMHKSEIGLFKYAERIVDLFGDAIEPDKGTSEAAILPVLPRTGQFGSTGDIAFTTRRPVHPTMKSHVNLAVLDTLTWEASVAATFEASPEVKSYVRNDQQGLLIEYEYQGNEHNYRPDFLIELQSGLHVVWEVKGDETAMDRAKHEAAKKWCRAVTNAKLNGKRWLHHVCYDPAMASSELQALSKI